MKQVPRYLLVYTTCIYSTTGYTLCRGNYCFTFFIKDERSQGERSQKDTEEDTRKLSDFDVQKYLAGDRVKDGEDKYKKNAYNQEASDKLAFDRDIPDVRHPQ